MSFSLSRKFVGLPTQPISAETQASRSTSGGPGGANRVPDRNASAIPKEPARSPHARRQENKAPVANSGAALTPAQTLSFPSGLLPPSARPLPALRLRQGNGQNC